MLTLLVAGHHQVTKKLLEYGSNIDQTNKNGFTALIKAAIHDHHSCVELLLKAGLYTPLS